MTAPYRELIPRLAPSRDQSVNCVTSRLTAVHAVRWLTSLSLAAACRCTRLLAVPTALRVMVTDGRVHVQHPRVHDDAQPVRLRRPVVLAVDCSGRAQCVAAALVCLLHRLVQQVLDLVDPGRSQTRTDTGTETAGGARAAPDPAELAPQSIPRP